MPRIFSIVPGAEIVIGNLGTATNTVGVEVSEKVARYLGPDLRIERPEASEQMPEGESFLTSRRGRPRR
jgi:hypothetical protein